MEKIELLGALRGFCAADLGGPREEPFYELCGRTMAFDRLATPITRNFMEEATPGRVLHWPVAVLLRLAFVQECLGLTAAAAAGLLAERASVRRFAGLRVEDVCPDAETLVLFRRRLRGFPIGQALLEGALRVMRRFGVIADAAKPFDPAVAEAVDGADDGSAAAGALAMKPSTGSQPSDAAAELPPFVVVMGLHRSGSSCTAGVLHKLGVHMGECLRGYERPCGYEAVGLMCLCEAAYPFPTTELQVTGDELHRRLSEYVGYVRRSAARRNRPMAGGKYPALCAMGPALAAVCGPALRVIHIDRPVEASIRSLQERSRVNTGALVIEDEQAERVQRWLESEKRRFLSSHGHLRVGWGQLVADPAGEVARIVEYLGLAPSAQQLAQAAAHVDCGRGVIGGARAAVPAMSVDGGGSPG